MPVRSHRIGRTFSSRAGIVVQNLIRQRSIFGFFFAATDDAEGQEIYGIGNQVFQTPRSQKSILSQWNRIRLEWWRELGLANASFRSRPPAISAPDPFDTHAQRPANKS